MDRWNFAKFLVGRDGGVIQRYAPTSSPESIRGDIQKALAVEYVKGVVAPTAKEPAFKLPWQ